MIDPTNEEYIALLRAANDGRNMMGCLVAEQVLADAPQEQLRESLARYVTYRDAAIELLGHDE